MALAVSANGFKLLFDSRDATIDLAAIRFQLCFTGTTHADAACRPTGAPTCLAHEMGPHARQARQPILQLRKLHLQLAFPRLCVLGKDIEDQGGAIDDFYVFAKQIFQFALLPRQQFLIKDNDRRLQFVKQYLDFFELTRPDQGFRMRAVQALQDLPDNFQTGRIGQKRELGEAFLGRQQRLLIS
jgi:hypothetical protein